jgi:hypothetical protein
VWEYAKESVNEAKCRLAENDQALKSEMRLGPCHVIDKAVAAERRRRWKHFVFPFATTFITPHNV